MSSEQIQVLIEIDIYEYLRERSSFEDTPSTVLRRELGLPTPDGDRQGLGLLTAPAASTPAVPGDQIRPAARKQALSRKRPAKAKRSRAAAGTLLPEAEYHRPILEVLLANGGSASKQAVIDQVGERLAERLTDADRDDLESGGIRWQSRIQFARLRLADRGLIDKSAPRGTWAITPEGRHAAEEMANS